MDATRSPSPERPVAWESSGDLRADSTDLTRTLCAGPLAHRSGTYPSLAPERFQLFSPPTKRPPSCHADKDGLEDLEELEGLEDLGELPDDISPWLDAIKDPPAEAPKKTRKRRRSGPIYRWEPECCAFLQGLIRNLGDDLNSNSRGNYARIMKGWEERKAQAPRKELPSRNALLQHLGQRTHRGKKHKCADDYSPYRNSN